MSPLIIIGVYSLLFLFSEGATLSSSASSSTSAKGTKTSATSTGTASSSTSNSFEDADVIDECPENEEFSNCIQTVGRLVDCSQISLSPVSISDDECKSGCICQAGYLRSPSGDCIPEDQCYGDLICSEDEIANPCPGDCNDNCPTCPSDNDNSCNNFQKSAECGEPRCTCRFNTRRNVDGQCVAIPDCPPFDCNQPNEVYDPCYGSCTSENCSDVFKACPPFRILIAVECKPYCKCSEGYRRDNGICVPTSECPGICPLQNEMYSNCSNALCRAQNCSQKYQTVACPSVASCEESCVCMESTLRNANGVCVPKEECPEAVQTCRCGVNEQLETNLENCIDCVPRKGCESQCGCLSGYRRDNRGRCLPSQEPLNCGTNEEVSCVQPCPPEKTCRNKGIYFSCKQSVEKCQFKCICREGYRRNAIGECVTEAQCDQCNKTHEFFSCGQECDNECVREDQNRTSCPIINVVCNPQCYCEDGFSRDCNGTCIPNDQCPKIEKCGVNEIFGCKSICPPTELCLSINAKFKCAEAVANKNTAECTCKPGYFRQKDNLPCIPLCACKEARNTLECTNGSTY